MSRRLLIVLVASAGPERPPCRHSIEQHNSRRLAASCPGITRASPSPANRTVRPWLQNHLVAGFPPASWQASVAAEAAFRSWGGAHRSTAVRGPQRFPGRGTGGGDCSHGSYSARSLLARSLSRRRQRLPTLPQVVFCMTSAPLPALFHLSRLPRVPRLQLLTASSAAFAEAISLPQLMLVSLQMP